MRADLVHELPGLADMGVDAFGGLTIQSHSEVVASQTDRLRDFDQNRSLRDAAPFDIMRDLKLREHVETPTAELLHREYCGDRRLGIEHDTGIAQQTVEVGFAEGLSGELRDPFIVLHDKLTQLWRYGLAACAGHHAAGMGTD